MSAIDISEDKLIRDYPDILNILLQDRTTRKKIIWATNSYEYLGEGFLASDQISESRITGAFCNLIMPRVVKSKEEQKSRTKLNAEVFTPTWIVKKQNSLVEKDYKSDDLQTYIDRKWLEVSCGEAPYMTTRYDMETGAFIPVEERVGFVDRKLQRINLDSKYFEEWFKFVIKAYRSSYGFEWSGDSLLLARENLLYTFRDYYFEKWNKEPNMSELRQIADVISYNIFQMDGLKFIIPLSDQVEHETSEQLSLFDEEISTKKEKLITTGKRVKIMNWKTNKLEYFSKEL
ncbi:TPA: restriction endonuclease [Streptococcus suis]